MKSKIGFSIIKTSLDWENEQLIFYKGQMENLLKNIEVVTKNIVLAQMRIEDLESELSEDDSTTK